LFPKVTSNERSVSIEVGKEFMFECTTGRGIPNATFEWYLDGQIHARSPNETTGSVSCPRQPLPKGKAQNVDLNIKIACLCLKEKYIISIKRS